MTPGRLHRCDVEAADDHESSKDHETCERRMLSDDDAAGMFRHRVRPSVTPRANVRVTVVRPGVGARLKGRVRIISCKAVDRFAHISAFLGAYVHGSS